MDFEIVAIMIVAVILFIGFHYFFKITYFGFAGVCSVFVGCVIASMFVVGIIIELFGWVISGVMGLIASIISILLFILKWGLIVGGILLILAVMVNTYQKWKESKLESEERES